MTDLADRLRGLADAGAAEIRSFERTSARVSAELVRLALQAAETIEVQQRELDDNITEILRLRRLLRPDAKGIVTATADETRSGSVERSEIEPGPKGSPNG